MGKPSRGDLRDRFLSFFALHISALNCIIDFVTVSLELIENPGDSGYSLSYIVLLPYSTLDKWWQNNGHTGEYSERALKNSV